MSSRGKKKTTMAKLNREARLRERRSEKAARKEARRDAAANPIAEGSDMAFPEGDDMPFPESDESPDTLDDEEPAPTTTTPGRVAAPTRAR
jgi:hypothetical protein